jgi:hypothetical protein
VKQVARYSRITETVILTKNSILNFSFQVKTACPLFLPDLTVFRSINLPERFRAAFSNNVFHVFSDVYAQNFKVLANDARSMGPDLPFGGGVDISP